MVDKVKMAGWVLAYLALWRRLIHRSKGRRTIKLNFMTNQTFEDIVIAVSNFVLYLMFMGVRDRVNASRDIWPDPPEVFARVLDFRLFEQ